MKKQLATAYWAHDAALMAEIADATGRAGEAAGYRALVGRLRSSFTNAFVGTDGQVASGTRTAYVLAVHMNLVPDDLRSAAADLSTPRRTDMRKRNGLAVSPPLAAPSHELDEEPGGLACATA